MPLVQLLYSMRSMVYATVIFVYNELISKLHKQLRVRKMLAKSYECFTI